MLFKTTSELRNFLPSSASFEMDAIAPFIEVAEDDIIIPVLGQALYDVLNDACEENVFTPALEKLLKVVRAPIAHYAFHKYVPASQVTMGAGGMMVEVPAGTARPFEWQVNKVEDTWIESADNGIEKLLAFLDKNIDEYPEWEESLTYLGIKKYFINSSTDFNTHSNIGNSRRTYIAMMPVMARIEREAILPVICKPLFDEIKAQIVANNVTAENTALLDFIKPIVACLTRKRALTDLNVKISGEGVRLTATSDRATMIVKTPAEIERIVAMQVQAQTDADNDLKLLTDYLYDNADTYPLWKGSSCYVDPAGDDAPDFDQTDSKIVIM